MPALSIAAAVSLAVLAVAVAPVPVAAEAAPPNLPPGYPCNYFHWHSGNVMEGELPGYHWHHCI